MLSVLQNLKAYHLEIAKLKRKNHPRIKVEGNNIFIDAWCDGDEVEADKVILLTMRLRILGGRLH